MAMVIKQYSGFNKQPSVTVRNPLLQLLIDYVILVYLLLTGETARAVINIIESCHLSDCTLKLFNLEGFLAHVEQFSRLLDDLKFGFLVKHFALQNFRSVFLFDFLKWNSTFCQI